MQGSINGGGARVEIKSAMIVHGHHVIFSLAFQPAFRISGINVLQADKLILIKRRKVLLGGGAQIAAGTFDPHHFDLFPCQRIGFGDF